MWIPFVAVSRGVTSWVWNLVQRLVTERSPATRCVVKVWRSRFGQDRVWSTSHKSVPMAGLRSRPTGTMAPVAAPDGQGSGFGANSWLVEEMYEQFVADPASVSESWQEFFADYHSQAPSVAAAAATSPAVQAVAQAHRAPSDDAYTDGNGAAPSATAPAAPAAPRRSPAQPPPPPPPHQRRNLLRRHQLQRRRLRRPTRQRKSPAHRFVAPAPPLRATWKPA